MAPLTVVFTNATTNTPASWLWDFCDNDSTSATEQYPVNIYPAVGNYSMNLSVNRAGGSDIETKTNYITVTGLTANSVTNHTTGVASRNVSFDVSFTDLSTAVPSNTMDSRSWNFGNGETSTVQNPTVHSFGRPRSFTVTLDITKVVDTAPGVIEAFSKSMAIQDGVRRQ